MAENLFILSKEIFDDCKECYQEVMVPVNNVIGLIDEKLVDKDSQWNTLRHFLTAAEVGEVLCPLFSNTGAAYMKLVVQIRSRLNSTHVNEIDKEVVLVLALMQQNGIRINTDLVRHYCDECEEKYQHAVTSVEDYINKNALKFDMKQYIGKRKMTGNAQLDSLIHLAEKAKKHRDALNLDKLSYEFATGYVYPTWNMWNAVTKRIQSSTPNFQGWPSELRDSCILPKDGYSILYGDYTAEEIVILCVLADDQKTLARIRAGKDFHRAVAAAIFGIRYDAVPDMLRKIVKCFDIPILYGLTEYGLNIAISENANAIENLGYPVPTEKKVREAVNKVLPFIPKLQQQYIRNGFVTLINGQKIAVSDIGGNRKALNYAAQASGAIVLKQLLVDITQKMPEAHPLAVIHDAVVIEVPQDKHKSYLETFNNLMTGILINFGIEITMPVKMEVKNYVHN